MTKLKCKIIKAEIGRYEYIVVDENYKIITKPAISGSEYWVKYDAGGYHTKKDFNELYGEGQWEVDFTDMYSDESDKFNSNNL